MKIQYTIAMIRVTALPFLVNLPAVAHVVLGGGDAP